MFIKTMPLQLPIYLCQKNLGRMESQNHKITNVTSEKERCAISYIYYPLI